MKSQSRVYVSCRCPTLTRAKHTFKFEVSVIHSYRVQSGQTTDVGCLKFGLHTCPNYVFAIMIESVRTDYASI